MEEIKLYAPKEFTLILCLESFARTLTGARSARTEAWFWVETDMTLVKWHSPLSRLGDWNTRQPRSRHAQNQGERTLSIKKLNSQ